MSGHCAPADNAINDVTVKMIDSFINNCMNEKLTEGGKARPQLQLPGFETGLYARTEGNEISSG
jgi:hypothetical protein